MDNSKRGRQERIDNKLIEANTKLLNENKELKEEIKMLNNIINNAIKYLEEYCVDDEFYINLSDKEKGVVDLLTMLKNSKDVDNND